jgi:dihydroxy-acid dehydratase
VIAILNTWSDGTFRHGHFKQRVEDVKRGAAGRFSAGVARRPLSESLVADHHASTATCWAAGRRSCRAAIRSTAVLMGGCDSDHARPGSSCLHALHLHVCWSPCCAGNVKGKILVCLTPGNTGRAPRRQDQPGAPVSSRRR